MSRKNPFKSPHRRVQKPNAYVGPTICLRCEKTFESWDRRQNRLCPSCREYLDQNPSESHDTRFIFPRVDGEILRTGKDGYCSSCHTIQRMPQNCSLAKVKFKSLHIIRKLNCILTTKDEVCQSGTHRCTT